MVLFNSVALDFNFLGHAININTIYKYGYYLRERDLRRDIRLLPRVLPPRK